MKQKCRTLNNCKGTLSILMIHGIYYKAGSRMENADRRKVRVNVNFI